jgi:hypothetical protein
MNKGYRNAYTFSLKNVNGKVELEKVNIVRRIILN